MSMEIRGGRTFDENCTKEQKGGKGKNINILLQAKGETKEFTEAM